jgi:hypothetical protein
MSSSGREIVGPDYMERAEEILKRSDTQWEWVREGDMGSSTWTDTTQKEPSPIEKGSGLGESSNSVVNCVVPEKGGGKVAPEPCWCPSGLTKTQRRRVQKLRA